ncbi:hypothetical protein DFP72DRAFT_941372, partial [Ephemerocybe angulata]
SHRRTWVGILGRGTVAVVVRLAWGDVGRSTGVRPFNFDTTCNMTPSFHPLLLPVELPYIGPLDTANLLSALGFSIVFRAPLTVLHWVPSIIGLCSFSISPPTSSLRALALASVHRLGAAMSLVPCRAGSPAL